MITINFVAKDRNTSAVINNLPITCHIVYGTDYARRAVNQRSVRTADLTKHVTGNTLKLVTCIVIMKNVSQADGLLLESWFESDLLMQKNKFDLLLNGQPCNLGNGIGVDILNADFTSNDLAGVLTQKAPGIYLVKFKMEYISV